MAHTELEKKVWDLFGKKFTDNEILNALVTEQGEHLTYMDLRLMRADYEAEHPESVPKAEPEPVEAEEEETTGMEGPGVTVDTVTKPSTIISGSASLPSGAKVNWGLDQFGRINMLPDGSSKPTREDLVFFQQELQKEVQKRGGII